MKTRKSDKRVVIDVDDLIDLRAAAALTGLAPRTVSAYVAQQLIPSLKLCHGRLFSRTTLLEWINQKGKRRQAAASVPVPASTPTVRPSRAN
jgi:hypothetical protein